LERHDLECTTHRLVSRKIFNTEHHWPKKMDVFCKILPEVR
jgi:hypothetical protein